MTRIVQIQQSSKRALALVEEPHLRLLAGIESVYELAEQSAESGRSLVESVQMRAVGERLDYDPVYTGKSQWRLLAPIDHPIEPARCIVSGTGLTHMGSAKNRQAMHSATESEENDSMKIFRWGLENGKPVPGEIGVAPEWFYKGNGTILRAHNEPLEVPLYAEDGGEEAEIAGVYLVNQNGCPRRIGMAIGNEFSDHKFEKKNYLNLAGSKLRNCSIGPELVIDPEFERVPGKVIIERAGKVYWSQDIVTGEAEMCHSVTNIEHHHFKFDGHRRSGDVHVHYFGACALSFGAGIQLVDDDVMVVEFMGFGRPLRNTLRVPARKPTLVTVNPLA